MSKLSAVLAFCAIVAIFGVTYFSLTYLLDANTPEALEMGAVVQPARSAGLATATRAAVAVANQPSPSATSAPQQTPAIAAGTTPTATPTATSEPPPTGTARIERQSPTVAVTSTPTVPAASATPTPTATATATPAIATPTIPATDVALDGAGALVARVIAAEAEVRSGQIEAELVHTDGASSTTSIRFDFGRGNDPPRAAIRTTYQRGDQIRTTEQVLIGTDAWERVDGGLWQAEDNVEGAWGQVQVFLPRIGALPEGQIEPGASDDALQWHDPARNLDVILRIDPESGNPASMTQHLRNTGTTLEVTYRGWNAPVRIDRPVN